ncbi:hypothetical protein B6S44_24985 [Bosea sp. Tri-44]|uniref:hypothetical protein n=1 Tax=Bosea sp. Tri-44 TaxID=1972137 RepID=UPI00100DA1D6|nr:hypothetical protein [Bosea sp. Tri-44]RXT46100.1 hypothetical protein B6S44_24985 [Bosea sp. Tri-44]
MPNSTVRAAATGLPALNRRSLMGGLATVPAIVIGAQAAPPVAADDPALRAIAEWRPVQAKWLAALEEAGNACGAAAEAAGTRPIMEFRGQTADGVGAHWIHRFFDQFAPLDQEARNARSAALKASADYSGRKGEADKREQVRELEGISQAWCSREADALTKALTTTPTTAAGLHAVIMLMASEPDMLAECAEEATASLAKAASVILGIPQN